MHLASIIIISVFFSTSLCNAQSPYDGQWNAVVADSTFTLRINTEGNKLNANFEKRITSTNTIVYNSEVIPGFHAMYGSGVTDQSTDSHNKVSGLFDDIRVTGNYVQSLKFIFTINSFCTTCNNSGVLELDYMQGITVGDPEPIRFPNGLTFIKQ